MFVDYSVNEPGKCVCKEAGRLFLHWQYLPSKMRLEMPQSAHHSHLRFFQALPALMYRCHNTGACSVSTTYRWIFFLGQILLQHRADRSTPVIDTTDLLIQLGHPSGVI
ncbi:hypothetical protein NQZ68_004296 [Dissostichus eleginoides]|nr:hypothetical protein NQZ68_004296 [Dissostichus eleginoides]